MANDCDATISSGGLHAGYVPEVVMSVQAGHRIVQLELPYQRSTIRVISPLVESALSGGGKEMTDKLIEIDGRLRNVEIDVATIKTRLESMPRTTQMWASMGTAALLVIAGSWALLTLVAPNVIKGAVKETVAEQVLLLKAADVPQDGKRRR